MKYLIFILLFNIFYSISNQTISIKSNNFCAVSSSLKSSSCSKRLAYECSKKYCSLNENYCDQFNQIEILMKSFAKMKFYQYRINEFKLFLNNIKTCSSSSSMKSKKIENNKRVFFDICFRNNSCTIAETSQITKEHFIKKTICPCHGKYSFNCGAYYCAINKENCISFQNNNNEKIKIKQCSISTFYFTRRFK